MQDLFNNINPVRALSAVDSAADNTARVAEIVDHIGYDSACYVIDLGVLADADATFVVLLEHGDEVALGDAVACDDADLLGTELLAGFQFDDDNTLKKLGYIGGKRYTRMTVTPSDNTGLAAMSIVCNLGHPESMPTANPPD